MIACILNDAVRDGNIVTWHMESRMLFPNQYVVTFHDGERVRWSERGIQDFCVALAIGRGEIPDPSNNEGSYPA